MAWIGLHSWRRRRTLLNGIMAAGSRTASAASAASNPNTATNTKPSKAGSLSRLRFVLLGSLLLSYWLMELGYDFGSHSTEGGGGGWRRYGQLSRKQNKRKRKGRGSGKVYIVFELIETGRQRVTGAKQLPACLPNTSS